MTNQNNKNYRNIFWRWLIVIGWAAIIFLFSDQPGLSTDLGLIDSILRKLAHATEFGVLAFFIWWAQGKDKSRRAIIVAVIFSFIYAISDEFHQSFVPMRTASPFDVGFDSLGVLISSLLILRHVEKKEKQKPLD